MKNPYDVLHVKEQRVYQLRRETEVLRFVIGLLLDEEEGSDTSLANTTPGGRPAAHLLTNSERLEVVVGGTSRLRFAGRMCMAMEVMRIGKEFHIFVPTPQPMSVSASGQLEESAHDSSSGSSGRKRSATKERSARSTLYAPEPQWEGA
jgi:hypothetical protein